MTKRQMQKALESLIPEMEVVLDSDGCVYHRTIYLGSYLSLDPCGRFHHFLSPNGLTNKCMAYWDRLHAAAEDLGGWIGGSEGDGLDVFFNMPLVEVENEQ